MFTLVEAEHLTNENEGIAPIPLAAENEEIEALSSAAAPDHGNPDDDAAGIEEIIDATLPPPPNPLLEDSEWGPFKIKARSWKRHGRKAFGSFFTACPYHARNAMTGCTKELSLTNDSDDHRMDVLNAMRHWCNRAPDHHRQRDHKMDHPFLVTVPHQALVLAQKITEAPPPAGTLLNDEELDELDGVDPETREGQGWPPLI